MCLLLKSLYGLKQFARDWYDEIDLFLISQGFIRCKSDTNIYLKRSNSLLIFLDLYIDDIILISNDFQYLCAHKALLSQKISMTDNEELDYILGVQIHRDRGTKTLTFSQDKYISDILTKFNMMQCNPVSTPLETGIRYSKEQSENFTPDDRLLMEKVPYKNAIGTLQYLVTWTRWDLAFVVNHLAQFMANPAPIHWTAVKRLFQYLCGTMTRGLTYSGIKFTSSSPLILQGWSDADWACDLDTRRSTSGYLFQLNSSCLLSWQSCKQPVVALSSTEAEYIAAATATKELLWLQNLISELGYDLNLPSIIYCDNQSCIALSENPKFHDRSKHIDMRFHFLREKVNSKILQLEFTPTSLMTADILTKSLSKAKHHNCLNGTSN